MSETNEEAWERISQRTSYRCVCCAQLVERMRAAALQGGGEAAMQVLREYDGLICASVEWMLYPLADDDAGLQVVS